MLLQRMAAIVLAFLLLFVGLAPMAHADEPSAEELVRRYDAVMSPTAFDALMVMVAHRQDGTTRSYKLRALRAHDDKVRTWFFEPASAKGQEMLRVGDNMWVYMPNLKRAIRVASRESFQGGDFNNGDVLRVNYVVDYAAAFASTGSDSNEWALDLKARTPEAAYDRIKLWMSKDKRLPTKAEYYAESGKRLRSATFEDIKTFRGLERPSRIVMRNELATKRFSELTVLDMKTEIDVPAQRFVLDDLGR